jgi:PelA/Pel-15E family pectate lyase
MKKIIILLMLVTSVIQAQQITLRAFGDSANHWYNFTNNNSLISPAVNQQKYSDLSYIDISNNILYFQRANGGWMKNYDMTAILTPDQIDTLIATKSNVNTTFDNGCTYGHIEYLSGAYTITKDDRYKDACIRGINFILTAQYQNGGWSQNYPIQENYTQNITFNDGATIGIMKLFKDIRILLSYQKGLFLITQLQIKRQGIPTAWAQQYDEVSLTPSWGRSYEPPSICSDESCTILEFLMSIDNPSNEIINSVQFGMTWLGKTAISDIRVETFDALPLISEYKVKPITTDRRVVQKIGAQKMWSIFYRVSDDKLIFCDRDGSIKDSFSDLERERRVGYAWYTYKPLVTFRVYEVWQKKWLK